MPSERREAALLVNVRSRRGEEWFEQAKTTLEGGIDLAECRSIRDPRDLARSVEAQVRLGTPLVIVGGGDGTLGMVAHLFARSKTVLGVLPFGTGNAFARDLGIPAQLDAACEIILNGKVSRVDMGIIGDRHFLNIATIGLSTRIALGLEDDMKRKLGRAVYLLSLIRALVRVRPFHVSLDLPQVKEEFDCLQLVIGNGRFYAGPFPIAPDASIRSGWLSIYALASRRKIDFLKLALHMRRGTYVQLAEVKAYRVQSGTLTASPVQRVTVDGETALKTPVSFGIEPKALPVMTPLDFDE